MGATTFRTSATGATAAEAFRAAAKQAAYEHGHGGYTGTIAEKYSFIMIRDTIESVAQKAATGKPRYRETFAPWVLKDLEEAAKSTDPYKRAAAVAGFLIEDNDPRIDDKWGPAGCIEVTKGEYLFFGWASE